MVGLRCSLRWGIWWCGFENFGVGGSGFVQVGFGWGVHSDGRREGVINRELIRLVVNIVLQGEN